MNRPPSLILTALILLAALALPASAATLTVNQNGTTSFTTIQSAITSATPGDEIIVMPGTYVENINFNGKNITLRSLDPTSDTIATSTVFRAERTAFTALTGNDEEVAANQAGADRLRTACVDPRSPGTPDGAG